VLLELDAGERHDETEELWRQFDLLNIACGGHAGDDVSMDRVLAACALYGIKAGAHPSYPDREHFGRRTLAIEHAVLEHSILSQCTTLRTLATRHRLAIEYAKPHGALYHDANASRTLADVVVSGVMAALGAVTMIGPPSGHLRDAAVFHGMPYLREGFADRGVRADGTLIPRSQLGAVLDDPIDARLRARELVGTVEALCIHADTPNALEIARACVDEIWSERPLRR
jgi:UPF0271 protein